MALLVGAIAGSTGAPVSAADASPALAPSVAADVCEGKDGGTLVMARDQEPTSFDPLLSAGNGNLFAQIQIYDQLVEQLPGTLDPQPGLAESWELGDDELSYTFHLRPAKFSNGDPVTAEDVKFSLDRLLDPELDPDWAFLFPNVKDVEIIDDATVRLNMSAIDASTLSSLTLPAGSIISKKAFEEMGAEKYGEAPIGSGPFVLTSWTRGQSVEMAPNPNYWGTGMPHIAGIKFLFLPDDNARMLKAQSGEAQVTQSIPFAQIDAMEAMDGLHVQVEPYMVVDSVWLNNETKPLDDISVRQALNYATPKETINEVLFNGYGTIQNSMIPQTRFWDPTVPAYPYDLDKAKELMAQSSAPDGFSLPIIYNAGDTLSQQTAEILQAEWAKIGVTVTIEALEGPVARQRSIDGEYAARLFAPSAVTSDITDDSEHAGIMLAYNDQWKSFRTRYNSPAVTALIQQAVSTNDSVERQKLYSQIQKQTMADAPNVPLLFSPVVTAVSDKVHNLNTMPTGWWRLEQVCIDQ